jgi:hypothetical protein
MAEAKTVGLEASKRFKAHVAEHGPPKDKAEKAALMEKINAEARAALNLPPVVKVVKPLNLDVEPELREILEGKAENKKYHKKVYSGSERKAITLVAERLDLASFIDDDDCLVICKSANAEVDVKNLPKASRDQFGYYTGFEFSAEGFLEEVKIVGMEHMLELYVAEMRKYTGPGLKRRFRILTEGITNHITALDQYKEVLGRDIKRNTVEDKPYAIATRIYRFDTHDEKRRYVSLDIKSAVFLAYQLNGIITEPTWEGFLRRFTSSQFLFGSKKFRLETLGRVDVKGKNMRLVSHITCGVWDTIKERYEKYLIALEGDEILLEAGDGVLEGILQEKLPSYISVSAFSLRIGEIDGSKFFVKEYSYPVGKKPDLKCVEGERRMEIYVKYHTSVAT